VAQKLHDTYGYSYDNLKVLLGGWTSWKNAGYPIESTAAPSGDTSGSGAPIVITTPAAPAAPAAPQPKP